MADYMIAFKRRLSKVRRRWKAAAAFDGLLVVATEALGLFLLFILADLIYHFAGEVRLGMLAAGAVVLAALFVRHVVRPLLMRIPDERIALYVEERSPAAQGAVISAVFAKNPARRPKTGLSGFIAAFLLGDAVHRIDRTSGWAFSNLRRLRKHVLVACGLAAAFAVTSFSFPQHAGREYRRIIAPWESILQSRQEARVQEQAKLAEVRAAQAPLEIDVQPKGMTILRSKGIEFAVTLSRNPAEAPVFHYRFAGADGLQKEQTRAMEPDQARFGYKLPFPDINESFTYHVTAEDRASDKYEIRVHDPLAVRGIELTYHYPDYLQRDPQSSFGPSGDVTALAGTRVDVRIIANNAVKSGVLKVQGAADVALKPGPAATDGATGTFAVQKDTSWHYEITDVYGERYKLPDFFFVKAVPDNPPTIAMVSPQVDMSVHPLCELTFAAKVSDDFAIGSVAADLTYYRDGKARLIPVSMKPAGQTDFRNFLAGRVEYVLELEKVTPPPKIGDMIFYHMTATDRKGQSVKTDLFFIKLMPYEVAAAWPAEVSPPDLPHWDYLWTPDIILLAAAAWHIEQQRGKIPAEDFNAQCTQLAGRMEPAMNSQNGLNLLGGKQKLPKDIQAAAADVLAAAHKMLQGALGLLREYQPGKAAMEMQGAMALAESVNTRKGLQEIEMAQTPIHTGQPSGGYNQDPVMEQAEFRLPGVMSDSLTAFQQEDNPRHFLPPDYRRALRLKERTAPLTKELKLAGEIYASQEQLLEMAREAFGHIKLREAAEMSCTNDPAAGGGTKGDMIRVDKRAIPYASMDPRADMPDIGNKGQMKQPKVEKVKGLQYEKIRDNERAGPGSPHRSQTPGGATDDEDDPDKQPDKKKPYDDSQWKVTANDRRPQANQGGGGGGGQQQQNQPPQPGMEQQQSSGGQSGASAAEQQLAARQAALADRAGNLARDISRNAESADTLGQHAADGLREASREMRQAATSFQRGDLQTGIAQARRAQQSMRTAMHGMRAAQFGTLGEALAAAQQGASALTQNQYRVSQGTLQVEQRVRELSGEAGTPNREPGTGNQEPGSGQPGKGEPGKGEPGKGQPGKSEPGSGQPGKGEPGKGEPGKGEPGKGEPGKGEPGKTEPGTGQPGKGEPGKGQPGKTEPGTGQPGSGEPGKGQPGSGQPGKGQPGKAAPGTGKSPNTGNPQSEIRNPQSGAGPSQGAIAKAKAQDPRLAARMQGLAGEQLKLSESLKDFQGYVDDLVAWSKQTDQDRVTTSLKDVSDGLKQEGVAQKMVDAGVDLSQQDVGSARATQEEIEAALGKMTSRLREANDMLAGSKTGILSRAARQAKEIGSQVRTLAGLSPRDAQPGTGKSPDSGKTEPGTAQPGQSQPGQGQPGQSQPGQGQPGQSQPGQSQPGQSQPGQGQPGQSQPGQGQPGQSQPGRPGQGLTRQPENSLARRLADEERQGGARSPGQGRPGPDDPGAPGPGGLTAGRDEIDGLWLKARDLADTLRDEQLTDEATLDYIAGRVQDPQAFRKMFDKVRKAEAGKFADVVSGVGKSLDEILKETLSAKKLHSEQREECPSQYRSFVNAYFEALSKAATQKP